MKQFKIIILLSLMGMPAAFCQNIETARKYIYQERYNSAISELGNLLKENPNNPEAWYLLTDAYLATDKEAIIRDSLLQIPVEINEAPMMICARARVLAKTGKMDEAVKYLNQALDQTKKKDPLILFAAAEAQLEAPSGDYKSAIDLLERAVKRDKDNPDLYVAMGDAYRKLNDGSEAYKSYKNALSVKDDYVPALYKIGKIFEAQNNDEVFLPYFIKAIAADPGYAPALYELYFYYYHKDPAKAMDYLRKYIAASDYNIDNEYLLTDILYLNKKYSEAISEVQTLLQQLGKEIKPRMFKLAAYCYKELYQPGNAMAYNAAEYMKQYFEKELDSNWVSKDFELMGDIYNVMNGKEDSAALYYARASTLEEDNALKLGYYKKIAGLYNKMKDYHNESIWLSKYYVGNPAATNVDLFNWGISYYKARDYMGADTVFALYANKYPDNKFGHYWCARTSAAIDSSMEKGLAVPHYLKVIELTENDTGNNLNKRYLIEAYGYIAAYKANAEKDYEASIDYFNKLLQLDPDNADAMRYVEILKKNRSVAGPSAEKN